MKVCTCLGYSAFQSRTIVCAGLCLPSPAGDGLDTGYCPARRAARYGLYY